MATITIEGREYVLSKLTIGDYREMRELCKQACHPVSLIKHQLAGLDPESKRLLLGEALDRARDWQFSPDSQEGKAWANGLEALAQYLWRSIRRQHKDFTLDHALRFVHTPDEVELDMAKFALDQAHDLGNEGGPEPAEATGPRKKARKRKLTGAQSSKS